MPYPSGSRVKVPNKVIHRREPRCPWWRGAAGGANNHLPPRPASPRSHRTHVPPLSSPLLVCTVAEGWSHCPLVVRPPVACPPVVSSLRLRHVRPVRRPTRVISRRTSVTTEENYGCHHRVQRVLCRVRPRRHHLAPPLPPSPAPRLPKSLPIAPPPPPTSLPPPQTCGTPPKTVELESAVRI